MNFSPVRTGERVTPDLDLDNTLRRMAGEYRERGMIGQAPNDDTFPVVRVYMHNNILNETFAQFAAVEVRGLAADITHVDMAVYNIGKITAASTVIAVLEQQLAPGELGSAVVFGGTWAWVYNVDNRGYAAPSNQGLQGATYGYKILRRTGDIINGWERCFIMLAGGISGNATAETYFRLGYRVEVEPPATSGGEPVSRRFAVVDRLQPVIGFNRTQIYNETSPPLEAEIPQVISGAAYVYLNFGYVNNPSLVELNVDSSYLTSRFDSRGLHPGVQLGIIYPDGQVSQNYKQISAGALHLNRFENGTSIACWPVMVISSSAVTSGGETDSGGEVTSSIPSVQLANFAVPTTKVFSPAASATFPEADITALGSSGMIYAVAVEITSSTPGSPIEYRAEYRLSSGGLTGELAPVTIIRIGDLNTNPVHNFNNLTISFGDYFL